jgi:hypothetical protein
MGLPAPSSRADERDNKDIDLVILVDESTSLSPGDVEQEQLAVANIFALPQLLDQRIRVAVLPFSSGPNSPRSVTGCEFTELTPEGQEYLLKWCPPQIRRESKSYGPDAAGNTDFAKAIDVAIQKLLEDQSESRRKAILLLTDGQYDPDGDRTVQLDEKLILDEVLTRAEREQVFIWPLGFGDTSSIDLDALRSYASSGYQGQGECPPPEAALSAPDQLAIQIYGIISAIACIDVKLPQPTPSTVQLHPLVNQISAVVLGSTIEPTMKDPDGKVVCADRWTNRSGVFSCQLIVDGSRPGDWTVVGSDKSRVVWATSGDIAVRIDNCDTEPTVSIERRDQNPIKWSDTYEWPSLTVRELTESGTAVRESYEVEMSEDELPLQLASATERVTAELVVSSEDQLKGISLVERVECVRDGLQSGPITTQAPITDPKPQPDSDTGDENDSGEEPENPGFPWILIAIATLALVVMGIGAGKYLKSRKFPLGSELRQKMPSGKWILLGIELEGSRRVGIKIPATGQPAQQADPASSDVDIILTYRGSELLVETGPRLANDANREERIEAINYPFHVNEYEFRVDTPQEDDSVEDL